MRKALRWRRVFKNLPLFLKEIFAEWGSGVTGAASAPLFLFGLLRLEGTPRVVSIVFAFALFLYATYAVWNREHQRSQPSGPQPSVILTYDSPKLNGFLADNEQDNPLFIHNEGPRAALNIRFTPIDLHPRVRVEMDDIAMVGPYAHAEVRVHVEHHDEEGGRILDEADGIGFAIFRADMAYRLKNKSRENRAWVMVVEYVDADHRRYRREFDLRFDTFNRRATLTLRPPAENA